MSVTIYVEGGGDSSGLRAACRRGFSKFIEQAGLTGNMPKIVACGSRQNAYDSFMTKALSGGKAAMLLVDYEDPVTSQGPWLHLGTRDKWDCSSDISDDQCHLMVQVMESWFLADVGALTTHYGQGFRPQALPQNPNIEKISKHDVLSGLNQAAKNTQKGSYKKGSDSFPILEKLNPTKVRNASPYADRFIKALLS